MSVKRSGQAIGVKTSKGRQPATGAARSFDDGRQLFTDGTSRMNREVQVRICEGLGVTDNMHSAGLAVQLGGGQKEAQGIHANVVFKRPGP